MMQLHTVLLLSAVVVIAGAIFVYYGYRDHKGWLMAVGIALIAAGALNGSDVLYFKTGGPSAMTPPRPASLQQQPMATPTAKDRKILRSREAPVTLHVPLRRQVLRQKAKYSC